MKFTWIPFYKEFAQKLLKYRNNRQPLIDWIYGNLQGYIPHLKDDNAGTRVEDIDPLTVFAIFNRSSGLAKRVDICSRFKPFLGIEAELPSDFDSIPIMNAMLSNFMAFKEHRKPGDIERLWDIFEAAVLDKDIEEPFNALRGQYLIKFTLTMGLFWIRPDKFLALDGNNREYLKKLGIHVDASNLPLYKDYATIIERAKQKMEEQGITDNWIPMLSYKAWEKGTPTPTPLPTKKASKVWLYAPGDNARLWDECLEEGVMRFGWTILGDYAQFGSREEIQKKLIDLRDGNSDQSQSSLMVWNFLKEIKPGDVIYAKKGRGAIVGRGVVEGDYFYDATKAEYNACRKVKWTHNGEWPVSVTLALKTLTDLTYDSGMKKYLEDLFNETPSVPVPTPITPTVTDATPYSNDDFLNEVFISEAQLEEMEHILARKKNIILQGAPGVGKTFCAKRLAYTMMGSKDEGRVAFVQFHQNYSYEDFIMGYKPNGDGFTLKEGVFYRFCKKAQADPDRPYFFIIDEINRGNMSKIFGELLMLIEKDYRGTNVSMAYTDEPFTVPANLYIIGMMNTADRSLAMIDYALRRRFSFVEMAPGFETDGFEMYQLELDNARFDALVDKLKQLNKAIVEDETLGSGFLIGHSYLCNIASDECNDSLLREIVTYDILPTLEEYWFDDKEKVENWRTQLLSIF